MIEPDWTTAPSWAMWFAFDSDGEAWWYETKPYIKTKYGVWRHEFHPEPNIYWSCEYAGNYQKLADDWQNSLRQKPAEGEANDRA